MYTSDSAQIPVHVFHNLTYPSSRPYFSGYLSGDPAVHVFTTTAPRGSDHLEVCKDMYRLLNVGDDPEFGTPDPRAIHYRDQGHRSLSLSDLVCVDGSWYSCESSGFSKAEPPRVIEEPADEPEPVAAPVFRSGRLAAFPLTEPMLGRKTFGGDGPIRIRAKGRRMLSLRRRAIRLSKRRERSEWKSEPHDLDLW
ncbi:hypothetical protein [Actinomadura hibisca]|uniref:hypothetical protein n=1 Tax=Actinomadura hibisca TaxID=68565 RepID=UPI0008363649|nr:hypothetical protein [Actinomadura hibisca]